MADKMKMKAPDIDQKVVVTIQGEDKLREFARTLNRMASGTSLQNYWKSQKALIEDVTRAFQNYQSVSSQSNAEELTKVVNALRAISSEDISTLFKNYGDMSPIIEQAKQAAHQVSQIFSVDTFKEAFSSFDMLKAQGLEMEEVFKRFNTSADVQQLQAAVEALNEQLRESYIEIGNARQEAAEAREELESFASGSGMQSLIDQAREYEAELDNIRDRMRREFDLFLQGNGLGNWDEDYYSHLYDVVDNLFDRIKDGGVTSQEAIARVKGEFADLINSDAQGAFSASQVRAFTERLEELGAAVDTVSYKLDSLVHGGTLASTTQALSQSEQLTQEQRDAMMSLAGESANLQSVATILGELVKAGTTAEGEVGNVYQSITETLSALKEIGSIDIGSLNSVGNIVHSLSRLNDLKINKAPLVNLAESIRAISAIGNASNLNIVSNVNLSGFNDLHVSKASLSNLATYLPDIAKVNVEKLKKVSEIDLTYWNNLKVSKSSLENLTQLASAINDLKDAEEIVENGRKMREENERSRLATLERAFNLLTKLETAERNWTAAQNGASSSAYRSLTTDIERLQTMLDQYRGNQGDFISLDKESYKEFLDVLAEIKERHAEVTNAIKANDEAERASAQQAIDNLVKRRDALEAYILEMQRVNQATPERAAQTEEVVAAFQHLSEEINNVAAAGTAAQDVLDGMKSQMDVLEPMVRSTANVKVQLQEFTKQLNATDAALRKLGTGKNDAESAKIAELTTQITNLKLRLQDLRDTMNNPGASETLTPEVSGNITAQMAEIRSAIESIVQTRGELQDVADAIRDTTSAESETAKTTSDLSAEMKVLLETASKMKTAFGSALSGSKMLDDISDIKDQYIGLVDSIKNVNTEDSEAIRLLQEQCETLMKLIDARQKEQAEARRSSGSQVNEQQKLNASMAEYHNNLKRISDAISHIKKMKGWTAAIHGSSAEEYKKLDGYLSSLDELERKMRAGELTAKEFSVAFSELNARIKGTDNAIRSANESTSSWSQRIGKLSEKFATWFSITRVIMAIVRTIRRMVTTVVEIDGALTQLQIVTRATDAEMTKFLTNATELAKGLGQSITDVLGSIETFSRLGYDLPDASKLAEYAGILSNVANVETGEATTGLTSIIKGFNLNVSDAEHVADVLIEVGQKYAVSASEMMEAYQKAGAALKATNTSFEKSAGLIAAANSAVQNASVVGTALKTVSARIRGSKSELEELGESTEDLAESFSKYADEIKALTGFDIMVEGTTDTFKDIYEIFEGISKVWDKLTDTQQSRVAEILGGTRQLQVISSILMNWGDAAKAYEDAMNAAGVATEANERYMDSLNGRIGQFKATFQELSNNAIGSGIVGDIVDIGTALLEILNSVSKVIDSIGGLRTVLIGVLGIIATIKAGAVLGFLTKVTSVITGAIPALIKFIGNLRYLPMAFSMAASGANGLSTSLEAVGISATVAQFAIGAFVAVLTASIAIYSAVQQHHEKLRQAALDSASAFRDTADSLEDYKAKIAELDESLESGNLSHQEAYDVRQELLGIQDEIIEKYGDEAAAIDLLKMSADEASAAIDGISVSLAKQNLAQHSSVIEDAVREMEAVRNWAEGTGAIGWSNNSPEVTRAIENIVAKYNNVSIDDLDVLEDGNRWMALNITANADDAEETIANLAADFRQLRKDLEAQGIDIDEIFPSDRSFEERFEQYAANVNDVLDTYQEIYNNQIVWKITAEPDYNSIMQAATRAKKAYNDAISGDYDNETDRQNAINAARQQVEAARKMLQDTVFGENDLGVQEYLEDVFNKLDDYISNTLPGVATRGANIYKASLKDLAETISSVKSAYDAMNAAGKDMEKGGLSASTIEALAKSEEDYLKFLYEENGVVKLNTEAWKQNALSKATKNSTDEIRKEIKSLQDRNSELKNSIAYYQEQQKGGNDGGLWSRKIAEVTAELTKNNAAIEENQELLRIYQILLAALGESSEETESIYSKLNSVRDAVSSLADAYNELSADGEITYGKLAAIAEKFGDVEGIDAYIQAITDAKGNTEEVSKIMSDLIDELILLKDSSNDLATADEALVAAMLKEAGVANSAEQAHRLVTDAKIRNRVSTFDLANATDESFAKLQSEIEALIGEGNAADYAQRYILALRIEQIMLNSTPLNTSSSIDQLIALAEAAGETVTALQILKSVQNGSFVANGSAGDFHMLDKAETNAEFRIKQIVAKLKNSKGAYTGTGSYTYSPGSSGSSGNKSSKDLEEYIAEIDKYREALERLRKTQERASNIQESINVASSYEKRIALQRELVSAYIDEQNALHNLNEQRDATINQEAENLRKLGFIVEYNAKTNQLWISNLEHLNELKVGNDLEKTNELRKNTEELINTITDLNEKNRESSKQWRDLRSNIIDCLNSAVDLAHSTVDEIQNVSSTLHDAANEFAANDGWLSVDTYQAILQLGPQYMQMLRNENNELVINEERINAVIAAKTKQLAIEQAASYVERLHMAAIGRSGENLNDLIFVTEGAASSTWGLVYAQLALMRQLGELNDDQYNAALHNIQAIQSLAENAIDGIGQTAGAAQKRLEDMRKELQQTVDELEKLKSGCDDLVKYVMDMLRDKINQQVTALEEAKKAVSDYVNELKEQMRTQKNAVKYEDEVAEKLKAIAKLQDRINALSLDDSRKAQAEKVALEEQLAALQKELADKQSDHAIEVTEDALDKQLEAYEEEKDAEIDALKRTISSTQKLYDMAIKYIQENWNTLYSELIDWNTEYGSSLNSEITAAWEAAQDAANRYGDFVSAIMNGIEDEIARIKAQIESITEEISNMGSSSGGLTNIKVGNTEPTYTLTDEDYVQAAVDRMKANASAWHSASDDEKKRLLAENERIAKTELAAHGVTAVKGVTPNVDTGVWYIDTPGGRKLFDVYHTGGFVGDAPLKPGERYVKAKDGELIMTSDQQDSLAAKIDRVDALAEALSGILGNFISASMLQNLDGAGIGAIGNVTNKTNSIHFGDVYISGASDETVRKHREINRQFTNEVLSNLRIKR